MGKIRLTVELLFLDAREEYTDQYGRPHKILDAKHWDGWVKQALLTAEDGAIRRSNATVVVKPNPELEPVWVTCPVCGEHTRIKTIAQVDAKMCVGESPKGYGIDGLVTYDWEDTCEMEFSDGVMPRYECEHCHERMFDSFSDIEDYLEKRKCVTTQKK